MTTTTPIFGFTRPSSDDYAYQLGDDMGDVVDRLEEVLAGFVTSPDVADLNAEVAARAAADTALGARIDARDAFAAASLRQVASLNGALAAGWSTIIWDTADLDTAGGWVKTRTGAGATGDTRWTCPAGQAGVYEPRVGLTFTGMTAGKFVGARILKNGAVVQGSAGLTTSGATGMDATNHPMLVSLAVGDYIEFQGFTDTAGVTLRNTAASDGVQSTATLRRLR